MTHLSDPLRFAWGSVGRALRAACVLGRPGRAHRRWEPIPILCCLLPTALGVAHADVPGQVLDPDGKPIASAAEIRLRLYPPATTGVPSPRSGDEVTLRADAAGRFAFPGSNLRGMVVAVAPGFAPGGAWVDTTTARVSLRLSAPRTVEGKVLGPDGAPAEGVEVLAMRFRMTSAERPGTPPPAVGWFTLPRDLWARYTSRTDVNGAYRLQGLPPTAVTLSFRDPRFTRQSVVCEGAPPDVTMRAGCRVRGRLLSGQTGLPGWEIWLAGSEGSDRVTTGADGSFEAVSLPPGRYEVYTWTPKDPEKTVAAVSVEATDAKPDVEVTLRAVSGAVIEGCVLHAETRAPLPGVYLEVRASDRPLGRMQGQATMVSGKDGRFRIRVPPGPVVIRLHCAGTLAPPHTDGKQVELQVTEGQEISLDLPLRACSLLAGHVVDSKGRPVAGATVVGGGHRAVTGPDGAFAIGGLSDKAPITLAVEGDVAGTSAPVTLKPPFPPDVRVTIGPLPQAVLVGRVIDTAGKPVPGILVSLIERRPSKQSIPNTVTDSAGCYRFLVHDLAQEYETRLGPERRHFVRGAGMPLGDQGAERRFSDIVVVPLRESLQGRVVDSRGQPVGGATVRWATGTGVQQATSNREGRFRLDLLPRRPVLLIAHDAKGRTSFLRAEPGKEAVLVLTP